MKNNIKCNLVLMVTALFVTLGLRLSAQDNKGIRFEKEKTWQQIKADAKMEGKYIFMDVFATWCLPCREMDSKVYPSPELGFLNDKIISIKVQADSLKSDSQEVQSWYADAKDILIEHNVNSYPSLLFFSPEGKLVHRSVGFKNVADFKKSVLDALDPDLQYNTQVQKYKSGDKNYSNLPDLVRTAKAIGDTKISSVLIHDYVKEYLPTLDDSELFTTKNLRFIAENGGISSKDRIFWLIFYHQSESDSLVQSTSFSKNIIENTIKWEDIYQKLWLPDRQFVPYTRNPNWKYIKSTIKAKYGNRYSEKLVLPAQILFYLVSKNWKKYAKYVEKTIKLYPPKRNGSKFVSVIGTPYVDFDSYGLNDVAWKLCENCSDPTILKKALAWSDSSIELAWCDLSEEQLSNPISSGLNEYLDTKANLLYKLGQVKKALDFEKKAIEVTLKKHQTNPSLGVEAVTRFQNTIKRMSDGK